MAKSNTLWYIVGAVVIVGLAAVFLGYWDLSSLGTQPAQIALPQQQVIEGCDSTTTPELKLGVLDKVNEGTIRTDLFDANVVLNGVPNSGYHLASDTTVDVSPGQGYAIFVHQSAADNSYFGDILTGNVKCQELENINAKTVVAGSMTFTAYNDDDGLANSTTDAQAIGTGETVSVDFDIKESTADACLGTAQANKDLKLCIDYNSVSYKMPIVKQSGATLPSGDVPLGHTNLRNLGVIDVLDTTQCYVLSGVKEVCDYDKIEGYSIQIEAQSGVNPIVVPGDFNLWLYMPQVVQNSETGAWDWYYSNEVDANAIMMPRYGHLFVS